MKQKKTFLVASKFSEPLESTGSSSNPLGVTWIGFDPRAHQMSRWTLFVPMITCNLEKFFSFTKNLTHPEIQRQLQVARNV